MTGELVNVSVIALDPVLEAGTRSALSDRPGVVIVGVGAAAAVTIVIVDEVNEQVLDLVRLTRAAPHRPEIVVVATEVAQPQALHAIASGARGLLRRREADAARLARAVLAAASGDCTVPPDLLDDLLDAGSRGLAAEGFTDRERAVLRLVADGQETGDIARTLSYSPRTVTSIMHDITQRYRLRNRAHAVAYAMRVGLL